MNPASTPLPLFPGFSQRELAVNGITVNAVRGGDGPPVLLLHGYPQTHAMWHRVAPRLAERFTVVCPDLRGYGDSGKPPSDASHQPYSKRVMAGDQVELMRTLGFQQFAVVGHDRGARVARGWPSTTPARSPGWPCWTSSRPGPSTPPSTSSGRPRCGGTSSWSSRRTCRSG